MSKTVKGGLLFDVPTPLGFGVRTSLDYWQRVLAKHLDLRDREADLQRVLLAPQEVRRNRRDASIPLIYRRDTVSAYLLVAVTRRLNGDGFLLTAYRADTMKEGERVWPR